MQTDFYKKYIHSPEWIEKRRQKLGEVSQCERCDSIMHLHVHHGTYDRLGKEQMRDLFVLCKMCHDDIHRKYNRSRKSKPLFEVTREMILGVIVKKTKCGIEVKHKIKEKYRDDLFKPPRLKVSKTPLNKNKTPPISYLKDF